ncbi:MAG: PHB depolymerase family esterase [Polyangiales bacterium]
MPPLRPTLALCAALAACTSTSAPPRPRPPLPPVTGAASVEAAADPVRFEGALPTAPGRHRVALRVGGLDREVALVIPEGRAPRPALLIILHGTGSDGPDVIDECGALGLATHQGVVVAAPTARTMDASDWDHPEQSGETWWETTPNADPERNPDLLLVRATLAAARRDLRVDPSRVYLMGHSNGAFFGLVAAMTLGEHFAGVALNSGGLVRCRATGACRFRGGAVADCARYPSMPGYCRECAGPPLPLGVSASAPRVPFVLSHGTDDPDVSVQYTCALAQELLGAGFPVTLNLRPGEGHFCDSDFVERSWRYLARSRSRRWLAHAAD